METDLRAALSAQEVLDELALDEEKERLAEVFVATFGWTHEAALIEAALIPDGHRTDVTNACARFRAAKRGFDPTEVEAAKAQVRLVFFECFEEALKDVVIIRPDLLGG